MTVATTDNKSGLHVLAIEVDRESRTVAVLLDPPSVQTAMWRENRPEHVSLYLVQLRIAPDGKSDTATLVEA